VSSLATFLGWMDVTAEFEGSLGTFDCAEILSTIQSFLGPFARVDEAHVPDLIGFLGTVSTTYTNGEAVLSSGLGY
jgi:hypothetical protein